MTVGMGRMVELTVRLSTSLVNDTSQLDLSAAVDCVEQERIHCVIVVETMTKIVLEVVAVAAVVGNSSNFDSLEFCEKREGKKIVIYTLDI